MATTTGFKYGPSGIDIGTLINNSITTKAATLTGPTGTTGTTSSTTGPTGSIGPTGIKGNQGANNISSGNTIMADLLTLTVTGDNGLYTNSNTNNGFSYLTYSGRGIVNVSLTTSSAVDYYAVNAISGRGIVSGIYCSSDKRIKKDITTLNNTAGLDIIRKIQPMHYKFISKEKIETGFIAQEVEQVIKNAVESISDFILNINQYGIIKNINNNKYIIYLSKPIISNINLDNKVLIKIGTKKNIYLTFFLLEIQENQNLIIEGYFDEYDNPEEVLVYGTYINDSKQLKKNNIFTHSISAIKELEEVINKLEKEILEQDKYINYFLKNLSL